MSGYNPEPKDEEVQGRCPASGCPLAQSMFVDGGPWTCRYHAKQPTNIWPRITQIIAENERRLKIITVANALRCDEFDALQKSGECDLDELLTPVVGESHRGWQLRVRYSVDEAIRHQIAKIESTATQNTSEKSRAVQDLTSGILRKPKPRRDFHHAE